jgi:hypothetical protein
MALHSRLHWSACFIAPMATCQFFRSDNRWVRANNVSDQMLPALNIMKLFTGFCSKWQTVKLPFL